MLVDLEKFKFDIQLFADGDGGDDGAGNDGGEGNKGAGDDGDNKAEKTLTEKEAEKLATQRADTAGKEALKKFFEEQGYSQDQVEALLKNDKEKKEKDKTDLEKEKERADNAEKDGKTAIEKANQRLIAAEFKVQAIQSNIKYVDDAFKLADLSDITVDDKSGDPDKEAIKKVVEQLVKEKAYLLGDANDNVGGGAGGNPGNKNVTEVEKAKKIAEERNKAKSKTQKWWGEE